MKIPIIGSSQQKFGELWEIGIEDLIREAGTSALASAGLKQNQVDSLYIANVFSGAACGQSMLGPIAFEKLGISSSVSINCGDASGAVAINEAANSIISGKSKIAMVIGAEKVSDLKTSEINLAASYFLGKEEEFIGATIQSQFALITKKYLNDYKIKETDLHFIPSKNHSNAINNPYAQYGFELKEEKIVSSPMISDPLRMFACAPYCDGAAAIVMCSENISRKFKPKASLISSAISNDFDSLSKRKSITCFEATQKAFREACRIAGIEKSKIGLMELYDLVPISEIIAAEDLGFCKKGSGLEFIKSNLKRINISGGLKACGNASGATGVRQAVDIINRLDKKFKIGMTQTMGGVGSVCAINIFGA